MADHISYKNSKLFYNKAGAGDKVILLFHGFGQDYRIFERWNEKLGNEYSMFAFDLFFHGNSTWENQRPLEREDWKKILLLFFDQERIGNFDMAGFSIGAKFVLATLESFPDQVKKITLIAPDGIHPNFWYRLATGTSLARMLFRSMILKSKRLSALIRFVNFFHVVDKATLKLVESQTNSEEKRTRVYCSWVYFRRLTFNLNELSSLLNSKDIATVFILGKSDKIIPQGRIESFAKTLNNHRFLLLDAGHNELIRKSIDRLIP